MKEQPHALEHASVKQYCKALRMPVVGVDFVRDVARVRRGKPQSCPGSAEACVVWNHDECLRIGGFGRGAGSSQQRGALVPRASTRARQESGILTRACFHEVPVV
jgi:hypothetical protein